MKTKSQYLVLFSVLLFVSDVFSARGETNTWLDASTDWMSGGSWSSGSVPGAADIAAFPLETSENNPVLNASASVGGLLFRDPDNDDWSMTGSGALTVGTDGIVLATTRGTTLMGVDLVLAGDQTWDAQPGDSRGTALRLTGAVSGIGNVAIRQQRRTDCWFTLLVGDGTTRVPADFALDGSLSFGKLCQVDLNAGTQTANADFVFGGTMGAPEPITATDRARVRLLAGSGTVGVTIRFVNPIEVSPDGLALQFIPSGASPPTIDLAGDVLLNGPVALFRSNVSLQPIYTGTWSLPQNCGATCGIYTDTPGFDLPSYTFSGSLADGTGSFVNPLCLLAFQKDIVITTPMASSTYQNGTVIDFSGTPYKTETAIARVDVAAASRLGTGDVTVLPGGKLQLSAATCLESGKTVDLQASSTAMGVVGLDYDGMPTLASDATGIVGIDNTYTANLNLATLGGGYCFLGTTDGGTFSGSSIQPSADGVWRLGAGGGTISPLTISTSALQGTGDLQVGAAAWQGNGALTLAANNAFTGRVDVAGISYFNREPDIFSTDYVGSLLTVRSLSSGSAWGDTNGVIALHNSRLAYEQSAYTPATAYKRQLTVEGRSRIVLNSNIYVLSLTFGEMVRENRGSILLYDYRTKLGTLERLRVDHPLAETNGIVPAWFVHERGPHFLTYDATGGYLDFTNYVADIHAASAVSVVNSGAVALTQDCACYALRNTGALSGAYKVSVGAGGLIMASGISCGIDFGDNEGVVYSATTSQMSGLIAGNNGLTVCGTRFDSRVDHSFSGPVTVNGASFWAKVDDASGAHSLGNADNPILLNGGGLLKLAGDRILASRTITLGSGGGMLAGSGLTVYGRITGPGMLMIGAGSNCGEVILDNAANDYEGGTYILSSGGDRSDGRLTVTETGTLGTGDIVVNSCLRATLNGNANVHSNAAVQVALGGQVEFAAPAPLIGSLIGSGKVVLGTPAQATTLTVGGGNQSSTFYGRIVDAVGGQSSSLRKIGSGTFTLFGAHAFGGSTTVEAGALVLNGSLGGDLVIEAEGTLRVAVDADGNTHPGEVAGDALLNGSVDLQFPAGFKPQPWQSFALLSVEGNIYENLLSVPEGFSTRVEDGILGVVRIPSGSILLVR